jgi:hypothetical protein
MRAIWLLVPEQSGSAKRRAQRFISLSSFSFPNALSPAQERALVRRGSIKHLQGSLRRDKKIQYTLKGLQSFSAAAWAGIGVHQ